MANIAKFNSRVVMKHDTKENWDKATGFIPLEGEIIVYTDLNNIKIGDGKSYVYDLPFIMSNELEQKTQVQIIRWN